MEGVPRHPPAPRGPSGRRRLSRPRGWVLDPDQPHAEQNRQAPRRRGSRPPRSRSRGSTGTRRRPPAGRVCVMPATLPANMIVAPNSPSARAQARMAPPASTGIASGTMTLRKTCHSPLPSMRAASSSSRWVLAKAPRAERMKNGAETNVCASTTAAVVNAISSPGRSERPAAPEQDQQRESGDRRRQDDRDVDERVHEPATRETAAGQHPGQRRPEPEGRARG